MKRLLPLRLDHLAPRLALACLGLSIFSLGVCCNLQAGLGLQPWWALHEGMTRFTPLLIGQASMVVGVAVIGLAWLLDVRPGLATGLNILIVGVSADAILAAEIIPRGQGGPESYLLLGLAITLIGLGTAVYVKAGLGAGPRDSLMLGLAARMGGRVGLARNSMDLSVVLLGWLLGAPIGIGTIAMAFGSGPSVAFWFRLLRVRMHSRDLPRPRSTPPASA